MLTKLCPQLKQCERAQKTQFCGDDRPFKPARHFLFSCPGSPYLDAVLSPSALTTHVCARPLLSLDDIIERNFCN